VVAPQAFPFFIVNPHFSVHLPTFAEATAYQAWLLVHLRQRCTILSTIPRLKKQSILCSNGKLFTKKNIIFDLMNFSSKLIEEAVNEFSKLPGVGKRTALRFVLHLLKQEPAEVNQFGSAFIRLRNDLRYCERCHNVSDRPVCDVCASPHRDQSIICVVEDIRDVMAIENTQQYRGVYHVLGGIISPMDGIGPSDLNIETLVKKASTQEVKEVIMALSTTMEGDTTTFYLHRRLKDANVIMSTIARGIAIGDELEYADEVTLGRSIINRTPYENSLTIR
jgi:recombination protein RecR